MSLWLEILIGIVAVLYIYDWASEAWAWRKL